MKTTPQILNQLLKLFGFFNKKTFSKNIFKCLFEDINGKVIVL